MTAPFTPGELIFTCFAAGVIGATVVVAIFYFIAYRRLFGDTPIAPQQPELPVIVGSTAPMRPVDRPPPVDVINGSVHAGRHRALRGRGTELNWPRREQS